MLPCRILSILFLLMSVFRANYCAMTQESAFKGVENQKLMPAREELTLTQVMKNVVEVLQKLGDTLNDLDYKILMDTLLKIVAKTKESVYQRIMYEESIEALEKSLKFLYQKREMLAADRYNEVNSLLLYYLECLKNHELVRDIYKNCTRACGVRPVSNSVPVNTALSTAQTALSNAAAVVTPTATSPCAPIQLISGYILVPPNGPITGTGLGYSYTFTSTITGGLLNQLVLVFNPTILSCNAVTTAIGIINTMAVVALPERIGGLAIADLMVSQRTSNSVTILFTLNITAINFIAACCVSPS
jgi:hypothetical protein